MNATDNMISYAIITPQYGGSDQTKQFLGPDIQGAFLIRTGIQCKKPLNAKIASRKDTGIHAFTITPEFLKIAQHDPTTSLTIVTA